MIGRWLPAAIGACAAAAALLTPGTIGGGAAWLVALAPSCAGLGIAFERLTRQRVSSALTLAAGLAILLAGSLALARLGWLGRGLELVAVAAGIAATGLPRAPRPAAVGGAGPGPAMVAVIGGGAALLVIGLTLIRPGGPDDSWNHAFWVKRLWDLGTLAGSHRSGLPLVGESYAAWATGAELAGGFTAGCAALVIFVVAGELVGVEAGFARLVLALAGLSVVFRPVVGAEWPAVVFHLAAILSLRGPLAERRVAWHTLLAALALALVRDEYRVLAAGYGFAAVLVPRLAWSRREIAVGVAGWLGAVAAILAASGVPPGVAVAKAIAILVGLPLAGLVLHLLGVAAWRSTLGAMCVAVASYQLAVASYAIAPAMHAAEAMFAIWFTVALAGAIAIARPASPSSPAPPWLGAAVSGFAIAVVALTELGLPMFKSSDDDRIAAQFTGAVAAWRERGSPRVSHAADDVHAAQLRVPAGAAIAFWGRSAELLDFRRNPIRDVASGAAEAEVVLAGLRGTSWLITEPVPLPGRRDPWSRDRVRTTALLGASDRVELHAAIGSVRIYRVRQP